jgi:N-acetylglutamate synthase-like GNAT family acetyltransferase
MREREAEDCENILRSLPDWFGIEEAIVQYRRDIEMMETYVAQDGNRVIGFVALHQHNPHTTELQVMAIRQEDHGRGIGRLLVEHVEGVIRSRSGEYLQVKTLGPSRQSPHYERTRGFYLAMGFLPIEENNLWGEAKPCLILVKHLSCRGSSG